MNIFPRKSKKTPGAYYFGEFNDKPPAPFSISHATFGKDYFGEEPHYHERNQKVYMTLKGKGILNVNGKDVEMRPDIMIHVEPLEVHYVKSVIKAPFEFVVVLSSKDNDKKIVKKQ